MIFYDTIARLARPLASCSAFSLVLLAICIYIFKRVEPSFAKVL